MPGGELTTDETQANYWTLENRDSSLGYGDDTRWIGRACSVGREGLLRVWRRAVLADRGHDERDENRGWSDLCEQYPECCMKRVAGDRGREFQRCEHEY